MSDKVVGFLQDALRLLDRAQDQADVMGRLPPRLRPQFQRINPVVMVSGPRGTGKTSLHLHLQQVLAGKAPLQETIAGITSADLKVRLMELRRRLVWLETLDLEPLPPNTGLMAAIMARLSRAVDEDAGRDALRLTRPDSAFDRVRQQLTDLSLDVGLAWDKEYPRFGGTTDSYLHAQELARVEEARTSLRTRFADLLEQLAVHTPWTGDRERPLFVLPVDDIDLNPHRCLELLQLVQSIITPRFVVLLFGDYEVARFVVEMSFVWEMGRRLPDHAGPADRVRTQAEAQARRLAAEAIRKMIPPPQRLQLGWVRLAEALDFRPRDENEVPTLNDLLSKFPVVYPLPRAGAEVTLAMWVNPIGWPEGTAPSAQRTFTTTLRKLTDLWIQVEELAGHKEEERLDGLIKTLEQEVRQGLIEDGMIEGTTAEGNAKQRTGVPFELEFDCPREFAADLPSPAGSQVRFRFPALARLVGTGDQIAEAPRSASPQTLGQVVLLFDLLTVSKSPTARPMDVPRLTDLAPARIEWHFRGGIGCKVLWPTPRLVTVWEVELFLAHWAAYQKQLEAALGAVVNRDIIRRAAVFWLALSGAVAFGSDELWAVVEQAQVSVGDEDFAQQVASIYSDQVRKSAPDQTEQWLARTAAFLTPENAIDGKLAKVFHARAKLTKFWSGIRLTRDIRAYRVQAFDRTDPLIGYALLDPRRSYTNAVGFLLDQGEEMAISLAGPTGASAQDTFRQRTTPGVDAGELRDALNEARASIPEAAPPHAAGAPDWSSPSGNFNKQINRALVAADKLRRAVNTRTATGVTVRTDLDRLLTQLQTVQGTLTVWRDAAAHPANTMNGGELCPDLPPDGLTT